MEAIVICIVFLFISLVGLGGWLALRRPTLRMPKLLRRHGARSAVIAALVLLPAMAATYWLVPEPTQGLASSGKDGELAALLRGDVLAPPPPLPPLAFSTQEALLERPALDGADRRWDKLDADFTQRLLRAFAVMQEKHGYRMALLEGFRSPERQDQLAALGSAVTNASAWQSFHQYGLAADCAFWRDGKLVISEKDPWAMRGYQLYGEVAESLGLTWGGRWTMADLGHIELRKPLRRAGAP